MRTVIGIHGNGTKHQDLPIYLCPQN